MKRLLFVLLACAALFVSVQPAQAQVIDSAKVYIYTAGADPTSATPLATVTYTSLQWTSNLAPITLTAPAINPTFVYWNDTVNAGKQSKGPINLGQQGANQLGLPPGTYDERMTTTIVGVESAKSAAFAVVVQPPPPPVPSGVGAK